MYAFVKLLFLVTLFACTEKETSKDKQQEKQKSITNNYANMDTATFAGGCFWCIEASFDQIKGVKEAVSGYAGGKKENAAYNKVSKGKTNHAETVQIYYNPEQIDYQTLLDIFFTAHDPTQLNRQGPDIGSQYRSVIFYHNHQQQTQARNKIDALNHSGQYDDEIVTALTAYTNFYKAEDYHQDYEKKHPDNSYIQNVSRPKIERVRRQFSDILKE